MRKRRPAATGALVVAVAAAVAGWLAPRGPVTTPEAVVALVAALAVGFGSGWLAKTRWMMLAAPVTFMAVFEVARVGTDGPTVDGIALGDLYGVIALVGGRGIDALLMLLPLVVGCSWGLLLARRLDRTAPGPVRRHPVRLTVMALSTGAVLLLAAGLLRPATTAAIVGEDGQVVAGSVAEIVTAPIGGHDQAIMLRGVSSEAPVLLFLEGGPGGTGIGRIRNSGEALEQDFVVATWDQRGTGKSYDALEPTSTLSVDQMVADTIEVTDYLRDRFDEQKIYLVGSSWGTIIGTMAVQRAPERFRAYVGTGQMVDPFATDKLMYAESLADAQTRGDDEAAAALRALGEPPYDNTLDYPVAISSDPKLMDFEHGADYSATSEYPASLFVREYTLVQQLRGMAAIAETFDVLYPQLSDTDFRVDVPGLDVPVYLVEGAHEAAGRETLARGWFNQLDAPSKEWVRVRRIRAHSAVRRTRALRGPDVGHRRGNGARLAMTSELMRPESAFRVPRTSLWLTLAAAGLSAVGCVVGLVAANDIYGDETPTLRDAATAQDLVGLVVVAPLLLVLALAAARGSLLGWLCCLGALEFTTYNYAIYAFSIHFGPLFLVWTAVLGLSLFALITALAAMTNSTVRPRSGPGPRRLTGWFLIAVAGLFTLVWLREIVPDLVARRPSTSAAEWNVPTNPVHVLDLAFFLPAIAITGVLLMRRHWLGDATAAAQLIFVELTCLPILVTPFVARSRGHDPVWSVMAPIGVIAVVALVVLWRHLRQSWIRDRTYVPTPSDRVP